MTIKAEYYRYAPAGPACVALLLVNNHRSSDDAVVAEERQIRVVICILVLSETVEASEFATQIAHFVLICCALFGRR